MDKLLAKFHNAEAYDAWLQDDFVFAVAGLPLEQRLSITIEEIRGVTWDFGGERLDQIQSMQRLYAGGFKDAGLLVTGFSVMMSESGRYLKAFHMNVWRNSDGTIKKFSKQSDGSFTEDQIAGTWMKVKSIDLGYVQGNVDMDDFMVEMTPEAVAVVSSNLFLEYPHFANAWQASAWAHNLWERRGWQPWYAFTNGAYKAGYPSGSLAVAKYLRMRYVGDRPDAHWDV